LPRRSRIRPRTVVPRAPLLAALLLVQPFLQPSASAQPAGGRGGEAPGVVVARARTVSFPVAIEALGTARANESIEVRPQVSEVITAIHFEEGQHVDKGQVLVDLESSEARADVAAARANLVDLENQVRRTRELFETRAVAASDLDQRVAQRDAARAALDAAQSRLSDTRVRAPFGGRVGLRRISLGSLVTPSTVITTLDDTDTIKLDFDVPETALARLDEGLTVEARSAAWPDRLFRGTVASIDTRVDPVSRSLTVRARIANEDGKLRPGMFLTVSLLREEETARVVPEQAIVPEQSRQFVWVVDEARRVEKREVRTGRRRPGEVEVVSGLDEGEIVVAEGTQKVRPGGSVRILKELPGPDGEGREAGP
jgi:membrane fusion protein (multidrug efflux system)